MKVLGVVTARGGSKGIPRKNIRPLGGRPLLAWTAEAALRAKHLTRTILSTDDPEIADVGRAAGLDVPFLRPAELAADVTPTVPVIQHAVTTLEAAGQHYDAVCILQPTSPLRTARDIDGCIALLADPATDAAVSVALVPTEYNPHWVYFQDPNGALRIATGERDPIPRRQDLPPAYHRDGSVFVVRRDVLMMQGSLYGARVAGYVTDPSQIVDIDTLEDWARAEELIASRSATGSSSAS